MPDLPPFEPVTLDELRRIWVEHPDPTIRRMAPEIQRYRLVVAEIYPLSETAHQAYRDDAGRELTAFHLLKQILYRERHRVPYTSAMLPKRTARDVSPLQSASQVAPIRK